MVNEELSNYVNNDTIEEFVDLLQDELRHCNMIIDELTRRGCEVHIDIVKIKRIGMAELPVINNRVYADLTKQRKDK